MIDPCGLRIAAYNVGVERRSAALFTSKEEEAAFWDEHELGKELLSAMRPDEGERARPDDHRTPQEPEAADE